ncbi:MAG: 16S rRNA (guanine(527)-N(7))-methyltransferase RsmG [Lentisphaeria bacterium]|nr:16S rRNA (guanine(527)-N(7))-methyltransferase RsmG [Lentisphaeria bacterium]
MSDQAVASAQIFIKCFLPETLTGELFTKVQIIYERLVAYNAHTNLTRIDSLGEFWVKHVADSLSIFKFFPELLTVKSSILDVGCGAGFPSLLLALAAPELQVTAVDSIGKKIAFVDSVREELKISNLTCFAARTRELNCRTEWQKRFDIITARAVSDARTLYRENKNLLKEGGRYIFYKSPEQLKVDFEQVKSAAGKSNLKWHCTQEFELPQGEGARSFLFSSNI